jgi:hypothetical protein
MQDARIEDELASRTYPFLQEDMALQIRTWRFERVGWYVLCLIILFTLLGLFSSGPLSSANLSNPDGSITVEHQRFYRNGAVTPLVLDVQISAQSPVILAGDFLDAFTIESIQPEPLSSASTANGMALMLKPDAHGRARVHLSLRPDGVGSYQGEVAIAGHEPVRFDQFIYP